MQHIYPREGFEEIFHSNNLWRVLDLRTGRCWDYSLFWSCCQFNIWAEYWCRPLCAYYICDHFVERLFEVHRQECERDIFVARTYVSEIMEHIISTSLDQLNKVFIDLCICKSCQTSFVWSLFEIVFRKDRILLVILMQGRYVCEVPQI